MIPRFLEMIQTQALEISRTIWSAVTDTVFSLESPIGIYALMVVPVLMFAAIKIGLVFDFNSAVDESHRNDASIRGLSRWMFPKKIIFSRNMLQDLKIGYFNIFLTGPFLALSIPYLGSSEIMEKVRPFLAGLMTIEVEHLQPIEHGLMMDLFYSIVLLLGVNLGYWISHYLMHKIPALWEFHKVHHSAIYLTGFTNNRTAFLRGFILARYRRSIYGDLRDIVSIRVWLYADG